MLQSLKQLYGNMLGASDGDIGTVKDFYFDDQNRAVRYVVADTGKWLAGRQVLISPRAFKSSHPTGKAMPVKLTRKQIEDSPAIDTHKPVSRQNEEEYHRHYGWPYYWEGDGLWGGMRGFPILEAPPKFSSGKTPAETGPKIENADAHLRSTQAVTGYHVQATDGIVGHVCDFMMDDKSWAIDQLAVKTGHRFTGKEVRIPMNQVERISYAESTVHVKLTREAIEKSPEHQLVPLVATIPSEPTLAL
jgi:sporulation protein YlmC with PRC-barrel domain